ncbi:MAG: peptidoglycan-binding protein [Candidatus Magasanikbacteria bacterium]|nr:peptidoglycan-binding protein [Candidatus Magasanikbacteria bacterium]USN52076.1 MAG: peptidoglycan-binding protein [Candidatus Nomurabacteria bacterium]
MKRSVLTTIVTAAFVSTLSFPATVSASYRPIPNEFAAAAIYVPSTNKMIYSFKPDKPHAAASLSKLVAGLVFLDTRPNWNTSMRSIQKDEVGGGRLRVDVGTRLALRDWWNAAIGASVNNAMNVIARSTGLSESAFAQRMNSKVKSLGTTQSVFYEPTGMNEHNMTSAADMVKIAKAAFDRSEIQSASVARGHYYTLAGASRYYNTTNVSFYDDSQVWMSGAKTGYLHESEYNLVTELEPYYPDGSHDPKKKVIVVVLGAPTKQGSFDSAKRMALWAWTQEEAFKATKALPGNRVVYGMTNADVTRVQTILARDKSVYADGRVTGYFGPLTLAAVKKFQEKYGIAKPGVLGYGQVGPNTWAKLVEIE